MPSITDLLKEGQEILVQIAKEPLGQKGARITSHIALPGRYVVYMPTLDHMGVSRKIASDEERLRLKKILQNGRAGLPGGFIMRTAGEGKTEEEIAADMTSWPTCGWISGRRPKSGPRPLLLHHDLDIVQRVLRDQVTDTFKSSGWTAKKSTRASSASCSGSSRAGYPREAVHAAGADLRRVQYHRMNWKRRCGRRSG